MATRNLASPPTNLHHRPPKASPTPHGHHRSRPINHHHLNPLHCIPPGLATESHCLLVCLPLCLLLSLTPSHKDTNVPSHTVTLTSMTTKNNLGSHLTWLRRERPQIPPLRTTPGNALLSPIAIPAIPLAPAPAQQPLAPRPPATASERDRDGDRNRDRVFAPPPVPPPRERERVKESKTQEEMPVLQLESSVSTRRPKLTSGSKVATPQQQPTPRATGQDDRSYETPVPRTAARMEDSTGSGYPTPSTSFGGTPPSILSTKSTEMLMNFEPQPPPGPPLPAPSALPAILWKST